MQRYNNTVVNPTGQAIAGANVVVTVAANPPGSGAPAQVFGDDGVTPVSNTVVADNLGRFGFFAPDGKYDLTISGGTPLITIPYTLAAVEIVDVLEFNPLDAQPITVQTLNLTEVAGGSTPTTGTINLYSKVVDSRLYYKDSTGVEIGPLLSAGGGGGSAGSTGTIQKADGLGGFAASAMIESTGVLDTNQDFIFQGPSPYIDARAYGVRFLNPNVAPANVGVTATITTGSFQATLNNPSLFQNGDGITIWGAGATNTLATPTSPTVTPSIASALTGVFETVAAPAGATSWQYQIVARTRNGGLTAASTVGATATGTVTLGPQTVTNTSVALVNKTLTVNTATPHGLSLGAMVVVNGTVSGLSGGMNLDGWYIVNGVPNGSQYTCNINLDSRAGVAPSSTSTPGTTTYYNCNHVSWTAVPGAFQYYIYGRTSGSMTLIGVSWPQSSTLPSPTDPANGNSFDDYGSPYTSAQILPAYVPTSAPPIAAINEMFTTTIVSGAGTTNLTLAAAAINSVTNATALFDNGPNLTRAASAAITASAKLYLPPTGSTNGYVINSPITLPSTLSVVQENGLYLNETLGMNTIQWWGDPRANEVTPTFGFHPVSGFQIARANPGIYASGGGNLFFHYLGVSSALSGNGSLLLFLEGGANGPQIPGSEFDHCQFTVSNGGTDYCGMAIAARGTNTGGSGQYPIFLDWVAAPSSQNNFKTSIVHPVMCFLYSGSNVKANKVFLSGKGIYQLAPSSGGYMDLDWLYTQSGYTPLFSLRTAFNATSITFRIRNFTRDTTSTPVFANFAGQTLGQFPFVNVDDGGVSTTANLYSIAPSGASTYTGAPSILQADVLSSSAKDVIYPYTLPNKGFVSSIFVKPSFSIYTTALPAAAPSAVASAGGAVPVGNLQYKVVPVYPSGSEGTASFPGPVTTTIGNQTVTVSWTAQPGAVSYDVYRSLNNGGFALCVSASGITGLSYVDTQSFTANNNGPASPTAGPSGLSGGLLWGNIVQSTGGLITGLTTKTTTYTTQATDSVILADATSASWILSLSSANSKIGQLIRVKKIDSTANTITVDPTTGNIDGVAAQVLSSQNQSVDVQFDGTNWWIL